MCEICNEVIQENYKSKGSFLVCSNCLISSHINYENSELVRSLK
jgi:hypothetical protein